MGRWFECLAGFSVLEFARGFTVYALASPNVIPFFLFIGKVAAKGVVASLCFALQSFICSPKGKKNLIRKVI